MRIQDNLSISIDLYDKNNANEKPFQDSLPSQPSLLSLLRSLSPNLHKRINKRIPGKRKQNANRRVPPPIVVIQQVDRVQVVAAAGVLAHPALLERVRVDEVVPRPGPGEVRGQVFCAGLALRGVEDCEFGFFALDFAVEVGEDEEGAHEVVEGIEVVELLGCFVSVCFDFVLVLFRMGDIYPVAPECLDLCIGDEDTAERHECSDEERVDEGGEDCIGRRSGDELANAGVDELVDQHDEEDGAGFVRC